MQQMIPSFVYKRRAWANIKPWLQAFVIIALLAVLPGLVSDTASQLLADDMDAALGGPSAELMAFSAQPISEDVTVLEALALLEEMERLTNQFMSALGAFMADKGWILLVTAGVELLLTPVLMTPLYGALMDAQRKKEVTFASAMKYLRVGPKALLLWLWMMIRIYAWMLPGMALMILAVFIPALGQLMIWVGFAVSMVLGIRAMLHYCLAPIALVDQPGLSLNGCIRSSWLVMRTRKMEYFMLRISFVGWQLLVSLMMSLAVNAVMMAICLTLSMMANLLLTIYINGATVVFWDVHNVNRTIDPAHEEPLNTQEESADDLN